MANKKDSKGHALRTGEAQRSNGTYQYRYKGVDGKYSYVYAKDLLTLREKEEQIQKDILDRIDHKSSKMSLNQMYDIVLKSKKNLRESTRVNYNSMWDSNIRNSVLGNTPICDIKPLHLQLFYGELSESGLKKNTLKYINMLMAQVMDVALENDYIRHNPCKGALKNISNDSTEKKPLLIEDINNLLDFCNNSNVYSQHTPFITIAIGTCMRCGELSGLTWDNVDMTNRLITIDHQLVYKNYGDGCKFHIAKPKTDAGIRKIPMTDSVYKAFVELKKNNMSLGIRSKAEIEGYKNFVFVTKSGEPHAVNSINSFLLNIEKKYNAVHMDNPIPHLSAHILRHTGCTLYANNGMDVKALQDIMGHADASITMNVYTHKTLEKTVEEIDKVSKIKIG